MILEIESGKSSDAAPATPSAASLTMNVGDHPPCHPLAFRVGVVGDCPDRPEDNSLTNLRFTLHDILRFIHQKFTEFRKENGALFDDLPPKIRAKVCDPPTAIRAISRLAEGIDQIFADAALALGFELCCIMPFSQKEYENDFDKGSLAAFLDLAGQAKTRFELDGLRTQEDLAYAIAGRILLNQTDLLIAIWDEDAPGEHSDTEQLMRVAAEMGIPIICINARAPHRWWVFYPAELLSANTGTRATPVDEANPPEPWRAFEKLGTCVRESLRLPEPDVPAADDSSANHTSTSNIDSLKEYYREVCPKHSCAFVWKGFRDVFGDRKRPKINWDVPTIEEELEQDWPKHPVADVAPLMQRMAPYYGWTNKLALVYSNRYRSQFILAYLFAAFAVAMALFPIGFSILRPYEIVFIILELVFISAILALVYFGRTWHWHERWINYRLAAEMLRHTSHVTPFGGRRPYPQTAANLASYGVPNSTWMAWYVRCVKRYVGLHSVVVNAKYLDSCLERLLVFVKDQSDFHQTTTKRSKQIEERIHHIEKRLLQATLVCCIGHLLHGWYASEEYHWLPLALTFVCGSAPAFGAALAGILNQGEFRRLEKRSKSMHSGLQIVVEGITKLRADIESAPSPPEEQFSIRASQWAAHAAKLMLSDVLDWRVVFLDRPFDHATI